jgi:hypothetical protein
MIDATGREETHTKGLGLLRGPTKLSSDRLYLPPGAAPMLLFVPGPTLPWLEGFAALPFLDLDILEPVVIVDDPLCFFDFVPDVAPGPTLPSLDAPGAGCI